MEVSMHARRLAVPAYLTVLVLLAFSLSDLIVATWPLRPESVEWRFTAVSILGRGLVTPLLGLLFACVLATLLEQPRLLRGFSVLNALFTVTLLGLAVLYVLDALQLHGQVSAQQETRFRMGSASILGKLGLGVLTALALAVVAWVESSSMLRRARQARADAKAVGIIAKAGTRASFSPSGASSGSQ
jgi:hypothetical protein